MSVYLIAKITIHDRDAYSKYEEGFMDIFSLYKGRVLAVDEAPETLEGEWACTRTVLAKFPHKEEAMSWYESDAYQALAQHRFAASDGSIVAINGFG